MKYEFLVRWENRIRRGLGLSLRTKPVTLDELYQTLPDKRIETKVDAIRTQLHRVGYKQEPEVNDEDTRLKLFENNYRRLVLTKRSV